MYLLRFKLHQSFRITFTVMNNAVFAWLKCSWIWLFYLKPSLSVPLILFIFLALLCKAISHINKFFLKILIVSIYNSICFYDDFKLGIVEKWNPVLGPRDSRDSWDLTAGSSGPPWPWGSWIPWDLRTSEPWQVISIAWTSEL